MMSGMNRIGASRGNSADLHLCPSNRGSAARPMLHQVAATLTVYHLFGLALSAREPPACCAVGLRRGDPESGVEREAVEVPGWWPGARRAVRRREGVVRDLRRPPARPVQARHLLQRWPIGDPG